MVQKPHRYRWSSREDERKVTSAALGSFPGSKSVFQLQDRRGSLPRLTEAWVFCEVPEEFLTFFLLVPATTTVTPRGHHNTSGVGVHIVGCHIKPWEGEREGKEEA